MYIDMFTHSYTILPHSWGSCYCKHKTHGPSPLLMLTMLFKFTWIRVVGLSMKIHWNLKFKPPFRSNKREKK